MNTFQQRTLSTTDTTRQRTPLDNGHLSTTDTTRQRTPFNNGHHSTMDTFQQRTPFNNGHHSTTDTTRQWTPLDNGHHSMTDILVCQPTSLCLVGSSCARNLDSRFYSDLLFSKIYICFYLFCTGRMYCKVQVSCRDT